MLFLYIFLFVASVSAKSYPHRLYDLELAELYFEDFIFTYDRHYEPTEYAERFEIFKQNLIKINTFNLENKRNSNRLAIDQFTDLTDEEFHRMRTGYKKISDIPMVKFEHDGGDLPDAFDWRDQNKVSPVKDQGHCGSCWAFSTTGVLESASLLQLNSSVSVSEQQLVDCVPWAHGCLGGTQNAALSYLNGAGGIESEDDYPYQAADGTCSFDKSKVVLTVSDYGVYSVSNDDDVKAALVKTGPLGFSFASHGLSSRFNFGGEIFDCQNPQHIDHAVLLVGYGSENGENFWIVKNSWGEGFGDGGYFKLKMGGNTCLFYDNGFNHAQVAKAQ